MPWAPAKHQPTRQQQRLEDRPSAAARGYGYRWRKYRTTYLANHPLCVVCGRVATEIDHKRAVTGPDDPLFWDADNHQPMCKPHHSEKTNRDDGGWGRKRAERWPRYVVTGAPASGKSTWVRERARPGDIVWDMDLAASALCMADLYPRPMPVVMALLAMRDALIDHLASVPHECPVYLIVTDPDDASAIASVIGAELVTMPTTEEECIARVRHGRADRAAEQVQAIRDWYGKASYAGASIEARA